MIEKLRELVNKCLEWSFQRQANKIFERDVRNHK